MGDVIKLNQYGKGGWQETRGRMYRAILAGEEFKSGAMSATTQSSEVSHYGLGILPPPWREVIIKDHPDYVVWSYQTPIAWHYTETVPQGSGERERHIWVIPDVRYSATTSRHQGLVRSAMSFNEGSYIESLEEVK